MIFKESGRMKPMRILDKRKIQEYKKIRQMSVVQFEWVNPPRKNN